MQQNKPTGVSHRIILNLTVLCVIYFTKDSPSLNNLRSSTDVHYTDCNGNTKDIFF